MFKIGSKFLSASKDGENRHVKYYSPISQLKDISGKIRAANLCLTETLAYKEYCKD